jgi:hypothetical protein
MLTPLEAWNRDKQGTLDALNKGTMDLYGQIVKATPSGIGGRLRRSWSISPATLANPVAIIGSNSTYLLPLEMGRKPGKGISAEGQRGVALWARRVLKLDDSKALGFAYLLSRKYKLEGRPATGFIGLARPGEAARTTVPKQPVSGSILDLGLKATYDAIGGV